MAQVSACMCHAPCSATVDAATAGKLRWAALVAQLRRHGTTAAARAGRGHGWGARPPMRMQQVCSAGVKCTPCIGIVLQL